MRTTSRRPNRRGTIMPMMAFAGTSLIAMTALAMDLGLLAVSRTNCQSVADAAALTTTRTLDNKPGNVNSNQAAAAAAGNQVVSQNTLNTNAGNANTTTIEFGLYKYYDSTTTPAENPAKFDVKQWYPSGASLPTGEKSWTASRVTVTANQPGIFSYIFGTANMRSYGRAVSVYRPRDIAMTLDMTGSMRYGSMMKGNQAYLSCDPVYPQAAHWARYADYAANDPGVSTSGGSPAGRHNPFYTTAAYQRSNGELYAPNNFTAPGAGGPPAVKDWFYDPGNLANPVNTLATPNVAGLTNAFHHWDPSETSPGNPSAYIAPTYDYSGWLGGTTPLTAGTFSVYPTPADFADQSATNLIGDRYPRKRGAERLASPGTWSPTATNGAAYSLGEYLGWTDRYTGGAAPTAGNNTAGFRPPGQANGRTGLTTKSSIGRAAADADYRTDWSDFRDATWEQYGYDLNVKDYIDNRPANWDPRNNPSGLPSSARQVTANRFKGYVMGPGYWGKSFFMWPPDPREPVGDPDDAGYVPGDWRKRFFYRLDTPRGNGDTPANKFAAAPNTTDSTNVNASVVLGGNGRPLNNDIFQKGTTDNFPYNSPNNNNRVNYPAILKWIKQPPMALPPNLRAGRVVYYTSIPDDVNTGSGSADQVRDKAFWRNYIDYVLASGGDTNSDPDDMMHHEATGWPEGSTPAVFANAMNRYRKNALSGDDPYPYMNYLDNPNRPRHTMWFGPITMMAFLHHKVSWAGTIHESQTWQLKAGVNSVLDDIRNNHPNDNVGLCYFSAGNFGFISVACSQDFDLLKASLFYPKPLVEDGSVWNNTSKEFDAFNSSATIGWQGVSKVQNANGGTDPNSGLAVCFNILAPSQTGNPTRPALPPAPYGTASAGRRGRRGASKIVVFETDGVPNARRTLNYQAQGYNSYYTLGGNTSTTGSVASTAALDVVDQIVAPLASSASGNSGLSSAGSPARVYSIGFGDLFDITPQPQGALDARQFLLDVQKRGGTSGAADAAIPSYQIITGPYQQRIDSLKTAFERILQSGVQVTLIE